MISKTILACLLLIATLSQAQVRGQDGNGGAGVNRDGKYMSFYSAGLYVRPSNSQATVNAQIPAIDDLIEFISKSELLNLEIKNSLLDSAMPTIARQYHVASPEALTPKVYARLMEEYKRVTGIKPAQLQLFAITDIPQKVTYILPGFEKLRREDQVALLFHEAFWIMYPSSSYKQVIEAEMAFQAHYMNPRDPAAEYDFLSKAGASRRKVAFALAKWDLSQGNLNGFVNKKGEFPLKNLYGDEFIQCAKPLAAWNSDRTEICDVYLKKNLYSLLRAYPKSMLLRKMAESLTTLGKDNIMAYQGETGSGLAPDRDGMVTLRDALWGITPKNYMKIMNCPVHLLETDEVDCKAGGYFEGGHLLLNI